MCAESDVDANRISTLNAIASMLHTAVFLRQERGNCSKNRIDTFKS